MSATADRDVTITDVQDAARNPLGLKRIHHVQLWVGNAKQASYYYRKAFGFSQVAYSGLETGNRQEASYVLSQGKIRFVVSTPLEQNHPASQHIQRHGDGVRDIALLVEDADFAFNEAVRRGAEGVVEPHDRTDANGTVRRAVIRTYGETVHTLLSTTNYSGPFLPGYREALIEEPAAGLLFVDHIVGNVELGAMNRWAEWYSKVMGFSRYITFDDKDISTEYSALMSIVMSDDTHVVKFPINEPAAGKKKSQIEEYLDWYGGPGVQHLALLTGDIVSTVRRLRAQGVEFLQVPDSYYVSLQERIGPIDESMDEIRELNILVDRDQEGYLLQLFSKPVQDRPTMFFEIIQRRGSRGFGKGNFRALFEAIELEQERRGNL